MKRLSKGSNMFARLTRWPKWLWKSLFWVSLVVCLIAFGFTIIDKIKMDPISSIYQTVIEFFPKDKFCTVPIRIASTISTVLFCFLWLYKDRFYILSVRSFSHDLGSVDLETIEKNYSLSSMELDVCDEVKEEEYNKAVLKVDLECESFIRKSKGAYTGFYGIAHTPLLFRMGYNIGDQTNIKLFHKARSNQSQFKEWVNDGAGFMLDAPQEINRNVQSNELIVAISTTFEIKQNEISDLQPDSKHIIMFRGKNCGFDVITSYRDAERARDEITEKVRELVKKYDIIKIHLLISSSAAFTFFLGMAYSKQHDPECVVYHYQRPNYPWGISIKATADRCIIQAKQQEQLSARK